ncbi:hypothetical protein PaeBR_14070 [Paenibacillus sp. BR2-3]
MNFSPDSNPAGIPWCSAASPASELSRPDPDGHKRIGREGTESKIPILVQACLQRGFLIGDMAQNQRFNL